MKLPTGLLKGYKGIAIIAGGILVVLAGAVVILPQLIPSSVYREQIQTAAYEALGRPVSVTGDIKVSVFPRIEARAGATTVANPAGFGDAPFASMGELRAAVKLWPLLWQEVEIEEFVLVEPRIALVSMPDGSNNWTFEPKKKTTTKEPKPGAKPLRASLGDVQIIDGSVTFEDRKTGQTHRLEKLDLNADMQAMDKPFRIRASGLANDLEFSLTSRIENPESLIGGAASPVELKLDTELLEASLEGDVLLGDAPSYDLRFDGQAPSVTALADRFQIADLPARAALGKVIAKGRLIGSDGDITLQMEDARHESDLLNADFNGVIRLADFIYIDIVAKAEAPKLDALAAAIAFASPGEGILGKATAGAKISGKLGALDISDIVLRHDSGLLTIRFDGSAKYGADLTYAGDLAIAAPDLKKLAAAAGTELPASDTVYKSFSMSGTTSGNTSDVRLSNAKIQFDGISGEGEARLGLGSGKPKLAATLTTSAIDITPYATTAGAPPETEKQDGGGWGDTKVDLSPLNLADADLTLKAAGLKYQKFDFGPTNLLVALRDGRLVADLKQTTLFGGAGTATLVADGSSAAPAVGIKANIKDMALQNLLMASANFGYLQGLGDLEINLTGSGQTLQALMGSLDGTGKVLFDEGTVQGVNLNQLVQGAQQMLTNRSLPLSAFGKDAKTQFQNLNASFSVANGVAAMQDLKFGNDLMTVSGGGSLNLGEQTLSLSLFPQLKNNTGSLGGYGLPVKLSGGWGGVNVGFDFDWLAQRATADVKARVSSEIEKELRNQLGGDVADVLSGKKPASNDPAAQPPAEGDAAAQPKVEDLLKREAGKALGDLFKRD
jgi:AsmA protein